MGLLDRAEYIKNQPEGGESQYSDLPPLRWFNVKAGDHTGEYLYSMHVLPFTPEGSDRTEEFIEQYKHYRLPVGFDAGKMVTQNRVCVEKTDPKSGLKCPFCRVIEEQLANTSDDAKRKDINQFRARLGAYANVIPMKAANKNIQYSDEEGGTPYLPHIVSVNQTVYDGIVKWMLQNEVFENPSVTPFNPWDSLQLQITVKRQGQRKMDVRYSVGFGLKRSPVVDTTKGPEHAQAYMEHLYENIYDLTKIFKAPSEEKLVEYEAEAEAFAKMLSSKTAAQAPATNPFSTQKRSVPPPPANLMTPPVESPKATVEVPAPAQPEAAEIAKPKAGPKKFPAPPAAAGAKPF